MSSRSFTLPSHESDDDTKWVKPPPPKLFKRSRNPTERVRLYVFGWPITIEDQLEWADMLNIPVELGECARIDEAWSTMRSLLPRKTKRTTLVKYKGGGGTIALCIYIGNNESPSELKRAQSSKLIYETWKVLQIDTDPQWLKVDEQPH